MDKNDVIHIAYAEDHVAVRESIIKFLHDLGGISVTIEANNGIEMLTKLVNATHIPEICIIDINMPQMDGFNLLIEIKKRWPLMKILVLTKYGSEASVVKMIKNGANGYLTKECTVEEIRNALVSIHETGYYYSQVAGHDMFNSVQSNDLKPLQLTDNESVLLKHFVSGMTNEEAAQKMNKTIRSIKRSQERLCKKMNVKNRTGLILFAIKYGIVPVDF
jgi:two-component system invasion response regulator UvrY